MSLYRSGFKAWKAPEYWDGELRISYYERQDEKTFVAVEWKMVELPQYQMLPDGAARTIPVEAAQSLMNELWECGIRPAQGAGSAGQLSATLAHLEDMRTLVFKAKP